MEIETVLVCLISAVTAAGHLHMRLVDVIMMVYI